MIAYKNLIALHTDSAQPIYVQLAHGLISLIRNGALRPGTRLPSVRAFAQLMQLHPKTIVAAYAEMQAQDWIYSKPRSGMIVSENLPVLKPRTFHQAGAPGYKRNGGENLSEVRFKYIINDGFPDPRIAPVTPLLRHYKSFFYGEETELHSMFTETAGSGRLRMALTRYLGETRGINIGPGNILLTRGAQMAIYIGAALAIKPGDLVMVGDPSYTMANMIFEKMGARLIRIPVDEEGMDVDAVEKACKRNPRLLYIIPHHHHPTTVTLSAPRRMKLLSLIRTHRFHVIEDDYDYEFHYTHNPILPLASADHGGYVWYIGSITKNLFPSMRVGYLVAPEGIITEGAEFRKLMDIRGDTLMENALATLYDNGSMQRHIRKSHKLYLERRDRFCVLLEKELGDSVSFRVPDGGMAVWVRFNRPHDLSAIAARAAKQGLWMSDGKFYDTPGARFNGLRMGFASLDEKEMSAVLRIIKRSM